MIEIRGVRLAAGSHALIRREGRIAVDELHAIKRHAQLLGDQLRLRRRDALAELFLAAIGGDAAIGRDRDPGIHLIGRRRSGRAAFEHPLSAERARPPDPPC